ncbi:MAG: hypothetical protein NZM35_04455 [Chitinophagales bacterium]|nr:hypothetical protein [Chitinophagales bacterium]MDW8419844.1 hypothetical protein [Chitinophagales bacterium]
MRILLAVWGVAGLWVSLRAQTHVMLRDSVPMFWIKGNAFYTPDRRQLLYILKGNIFFTGESDSRENIYLYGTSLNPFDKKKNTLYLRNQSKPVLTYASGVFYAIPTDADPDNRNNEVLRVQRSGKWLAFYASYNDSLLAYYAADSAPPAAAILVAFALAERYDLLKNITNNTNTLPPARPAFSTLRPLWGNTTAREWIWDGRLLRPRWNNNPFLAWTFDGRYIKPYMGNNIYEEYEWDGEYLRPVWRSNRQFEWQWDGRIFKPVWDTDWKNQYTIANGTVKPWSNVHTEREWVIEGDFPLPLIIMVVSGAARSE